MERAVIYARYSSDRQREESIDAQVRACREYCQRKGYLVIKIYADEAQSGKSIAKRDQYKKMLADSQKDLFDVVVFHKIDRNSRNELDYYITKNQLISSGIKYEYAAQNIDTSPAGQMVEGILVAVAANYSRNLAEETKKGLRENALKALFNGGTPPLGYKIVNKRYEIEPREAEAVRLIFKLYISGNGYAKISKALNAQGYRTKRGQNFGKNSLHDILCNPRYYGTYIFNKTVRTASGKRNSHSVSDDVIEIENALPPIITKETFVRAQEKMKTNQRISARYNAKERYLLTGKIYCGLCGSSMCGNRTVIRDTVYNYYVCSRVERVAADRCPQKQLPQHIVEDLVLNNIKQVFFNPAKLPSLIKRAAGMSDRYLPKVEAEKASLLQQKQNAERKLNNLYSMVEDGIADEYDLKRLKDIKDELKSINSKLSNLPDSNQQEISEEYIRSIFDEYNKILQNKNDPDTMTRLFDSFVHRVEVFEEKIKLQLKLEFGKHMVPRTGIEPVRGSLPEGF